jgi:hypothetical protein
VAQGTAVPLNRTERVLAFVLAGVGALTVAAIVALLVARAAGVSDLSGGLWPTVAVLPLIGLPVLLVLAIVLIVAMSTRRRRLAAGDARR